MLLLLLTPLQLMPAGQGSQKVCLLSLITLSASVRIKSCSFHQHVFHILNCAAVCAFSLICFVCCRQLCCFRLSTVATDEWRGKQADMCALFVMHKQEVGRLGELGAEGVYTNQHPPPLSHANEVLGISRTLLLP